MAEGYAHVTGRPGVALVTSGPAATNMVTPLMDAYMDSIPMVCITGQVPTDAIGTDAFQECDTVGITRSITKHNELVMTRAGHADGRAPGVPHRHHRPPRPDADRRPQGRASPNTMDWYWPTDDEVIDSLPGYRPNTKGHPRMIKEAAKLILASERPILYVGGGVLKARAAEALRELAELTDIHVVTTLMARGAFPDDHPLCLGMPGMHGNATAITAMQKSDLLITSAPASTTASPARSSAFAPEAKIIHVDIDPAEQGKVRRPDVPIVGDCQATSSRRSSRRSRTCSHGGTVQADTGAWKSRISGWREQFPLSYEPSEPGEALKPQFCLEQLRDSAPEGTILGRGVGQHQMWSSQYWKFNEPYTWVNSGGLGTMGFSVPAAIGAKVGRPDRTVWAIDGDGCFQMTAQELVTASVERIPIKVGDPQQQLPRHGAPVAGDVLRRALQRGVPVARGARLREVGRGDGLRRHPRRQPRRSAAGHRQGQQHRRPPGRRRLPRRRPREGVPDGARRLQQRRHAAARSGRKRNRGGPASERRSPTTTSCRCSCRTGPACSPAWPACSPAAASTSSASRSRRPRTRASAASPSWSTWRARRSSRSSSSCSS